MNPETTSTQAAADATKSKSPLRHVTTVVRILMGLAFFTFGLNFYLNFIPQPKAPMP